MANKRMFSKTITNSARFLKMPIDSQCLYFHLGLNADDDGIVEAYPILKITGSSEDNLRVLAAKNFIRILNEDLVAHITDWNEHNLIRADRKVDSIYKGLLLQVIPEIELIEPRQRADVKKRTDNGQPMDGIGKVRLGKVRLDQDSIGDTVKLKRFTPPTHYEIAEYCNNSQFNIDIEAFIDFYTSKGWKVGNNTMKDWQAAVRNWYRRDKKKPQNTPVKPSIQDRLKDNERLCDEI